jgi:hypothetical protein
MTNKKQFTKTIYYAFVQELEVPTDATEEEIDDLVFNNLSSPLIIFGQTRQNIYLRSTDNGR